MTTVTQRDERLYVHTAEAQWDADTMRQAVAFVRLPVGYPGAVWKCHSVYTRHGVVHCAAADEMSAGDVLLTESIGDSGSRTTVYRIARIEPAHYGRMAILERLHTCPAHGERDAVPA
mgnify:CR=1 FL=1